MKFKESAPAQTSIPHLHMMNVDQVLNFLGNNFDTNDTEVTEKVDGSNFSVGMLNDKVFGKSKRGKPFTDPNQFYELKDIHPVFIGMGDFLKLMQNNKFDEWYQSTVKQYKDKIQKELNPERFDGFSIFGEIFNSNQMNTLVYSNIGKGAFVVFGLKIDDGSYKGIDISTNPIAIDIMKSFVAKFNGVDDWKFYYKQSVKIDMGKQFAQELEEFVKNNIEHIKNRKRSPEVLDRKVKAKEDLSNLLMKWKKSLLQQSSGIKSFLGSDEIEGLVIRNIKTGGIMKVVDIDKFSQRNIANWEYRQELRNERKELYKRIISEIVKSADIFILKHKQEEKIIGYLEMHGKKKFDNLEELLGVIYEDMSNEVQLDEAKDVDLKMNMIILEYIKKVEAIIDSTKNDNDIDDKNKELTINNLNIDINQMKELINTINILVRDNKNPYLAIIRFILGEKGIEELKNKFINIE